MPENEFEKKISSEMQELKFKPSEHVWLRVEERIKTKKKRRVFVVIFLLAGLGLLGYWQRTNLFGEQKNDIAKAVHMDSSGEKQKEENSETTKETNNSSGIKQNTEATKSEETKNTTDKIVDDKLTDDRSVVDKKDIDVSKNEINKPKRNEDKTKTKSGSVKTKKDNKPEASMAIVSANSKTKNGVVDETSKDLKTNPEAIAKQEDVNQTEVKPVESKIDSAKAVTGVQEKDTTTKRDTLLKADPAKDPAPQIVKKDPSEKKWKWGLHFTPGISSLNDNEIDFGGLRSADVSYFSSAGPGTPPPPRQKPSDIKASFAFQVGAFAQMQLSSRTSLSMGLQYGYYSNALHIGNVRGSINSSALFSGVLDSTANLIYNAGGDTTKYTNSYHFIEVPFLFQWQLNKNKAKPFTWSIGFTVGQLISSNAIMYDTAFNGVYYKNKSQLNKTQFSLSTGFSWTISNNKRMQWNLGPVADLHLSKLIDNPFENKRYLFFVGLRTGVLLNSKK
jgi:hypothetical protein